MPMSRLQTKTQRLVNTALNILFPKECVGCSREGDWLCPACVGTIYIRERFSCPNCANPTVFGGTCARCAKRGFPLSSLIFITTYRDERIRKLVRIFKYNYCYEAEEALRRLVLKFLGKYEYAMPQAELIAPVPLHLARLQSRGFNQSALIARRIGEVLNLNCKEDALLRIKNNIPQVEVDENEREINVRGVFIAQDAEVIQNKSIMLVDDVYTSGSTMQECARVLRGAGARAVHGFVIARG